MAKMFRGTAHLAIVSITLLLLMSFVTTSISFSKEASSEVARFVDDQHENAAVMRSLPLSDRRPLVAVITEPDAVVSAERSAITRDVLREVVRDGGADLIVVRCAADDDEASHRARVVDLTRAVLSDRDALGRPSPLVVVNGDVEAASASGADGVHVRERDLPRVARLLSGRRFAIVGASVHSIASVDAAFDARVVDYVFAGTCYLTASHPEKTTEADLEGPAFPGLVRRRLVENAARRSGSDDHEHVVVPKVFAIGGVDEHNCDEPVRLGADGVAVIRSVMQAANPSVAVSSIREQTTNAIRR